MRQLDIGQFQLEIGEKALDCVNRRFYLVFRFFNRFCDCRLDIIPDIRNGRFNRIKHIGYSIFDTVDDIRHGGFYTVPDVACCGLYAVPNA